MTHFDLKACKLCGMPRIRDMTGNRLQHERGQIWFNPFHIFAIGIQMYQILLCHSKHRRPADGNLHNYAITGDVRVHFVAAVTTDDMRIPARASKWTNIETRNPACRNPRPMPPRAVFPRPRHISSSSVYIYTLKVPAILRRWKRTIFRWIYTWGRKTREWE